MREVEEIKYGEIDGLSRSMMVDLLYSPRYFYLKYITKELPVEQETFAMYMGTAKHCALLEPDIFEQDYSSLEEIKVKTADLKSLQGNLRWKVSKTKGEYSYLQEPLSDDARMNMVNALNKTDEGHYLITPKILLPRMAKQVKYQVEELNNNPLLNYYLTKPLKAEVTLTGVVEDVPVKSRMDAIDLEGNTIIDYKSTRKPVNKKTLSYDVLEHGLDIQAALYTEIYEQNYVKKPDFIFIAQNNTDQQGIAFRLGEDVIISGKARIHEALEIYKICSETGSWPAFLTYDNGGWVSNENHVFDLHLPGYYYKEDEE